MLKVVCILVAFSCSILNIRLGNAAVFPLYDGLLPVARDISVGLGVVVNLAVLAAVLKRPCLLRPRPLHALAFVCLLASSVLTPVSLDVGSGALLVAVACLRSVGAAWMSLVVWAACVELERGALLVGLPLAVGCGYVVSIPVSGTLSATAAYAVACATPILALALSARPASRVLADIRAAPPASDAALIRPASFLPLTNRVFVCMLVATAATGLSLRFGAQEGSSEGLVLASGLLVLVAVWGGLRRESGRFFDSLFDVAVLVVLAGYLTAPVDAFTHLTIALLAVGNALFNVLFPFVLISAARRNHLAALTLFSWGNVMSTMGSIAGANLGAWAGSDAADPAVFLVSAAMALVLVGWVLLGMRDFSFSQTIAGIAPVVPLQVPAQTRSDQLDRACERVAGASGLTPRELEVLELLARGRNGGYIQEKLTVSHNTVKTYIRRVYAKLGVHSQQELIDLVDAA